MVKHAYKTKQFEGEFNLRNFSYSNMSVEDFLWCNRISKESLVYYVYHVI